MADVYKIGVRLALEGNMADGLGLIAQKLLGIDDQVTKLGKRFTELSNNMKFLFGGAVATGIGVGMVDAVASLADKGKDLLNVQDQLRRSGVEANQVLAATSDYFNKVAQSIPTASVDQYLKSYNELRSVFGGDDALAKTPYALKLDALIGNATGQNVEGSGFNIYRALEMRGTTMTDPVGTERLADAMAQVIIGSGGKVTAATYAALAKRGGASWMQYDPSYVVGGLSVAAADMGGDTAGTAGMSLQQFLTGAHTLSRQQLDVLTKAGLIDPSKVTTDKGGRINMQPGAIKGADEGARDPYHWVKNIVAPALMNMAHGDESAFNSYIAKLGSNRNVTRMLTIFSDPGFQEQIEKDLLTWRGAKGVNSAYDSAMKDNPMFVMQAYEAQKKSMFEAIGGPAMQAAIPIMKGVTDIFTNIGAFANAHKDAAKNIAEITGAIGGLLALGGTAAMAKGAFGILTGKGGLMGAGTELQVAAKMLEDAAVKLGAEGGPGVGSGKGGTGRKPWGILGFLGMLDTAWNLPNGSKKELLDYLNNNNQDGPAQDAANRYLPPWLAHAFDPKKASGAALAKPGIPYIEPPSVPYDSLTRDRTAHGDKLAGPPVVNVAAPQIGVSVSIDGQQLKAMVTSWIQEAVGNAAKAFGGFSSGAPMANTGTTMPTVDGATN